MLLVYMTQRARIFWYGSMCVEFGKGQYCPSLTAHPFRCACADIRRRLLGPRKHLQELLHILGAVDLVPAVDCEIRNAMDALAVRLLDLTIDLLATSPLAQPIRNLGPVQASLFADCGQHVCGGDVGVFFKVAFEENRNETVLGLVGFRLGELDKPVRVAGVADLALQGESNPLVLAHLFEVGIHHGQALGAEPLGQMHIAVDADFRQGRVEVEGVPGDGEGVVGTAGDILFVCLDGALQALLPDIALWRCRRYELAEMDRSAGHGGPAHPWADRV
jgi:hypothetical protein